MTTEQMTEQKCLICGIPESLRSLDRTDTHLCFYSWECALGIAFKHSASSLLCVDDMSIALHTIKKAQEEALQETIKTKKLKNFRSCNSFEKKC
jgi:hypothetical protein